MLTQEQTVSGGWGKRSIKVGYFLIVNFNSDCLPGELVGTIAKHQGGSLQPWSAGAPFCWKAAPFLLPTWSGRSQGPASK
jgi:hypothetical protein